DDIGGDAAEREERWVESPDRGHQRGSVAVANHVLVEVGQKMGHSARAARAACRGVGPVVLTLDDSMLERGAGERYPAPCVACRQSGPPREVLDLCRAVAAEVPAR